MKNEEEYIEKTEEVEGSPVGTAEEKKGICPVTYEMLKHPWLGEDMAKRIVKENLADDPEFYSFLEEEGFELCVSTYTLIFFNKYNTYIFILQISKCGAKFVFD